MNKHFSMSTLLNIVFNQNVKFSANKHFHLNKLNLNDNSG